MIPVIRATLGSDIVEYFMGGGVVVVGALFIATFAESEQVEM